MNSEPNGFSSFHLAPSPGLTKKSMRCAISAARALSVSLRPDLDSFFFFFFFASRAAFAFIGSAYRSIEINAFSRS